MKKRKRKQDTENPGRKIIMEGTILLKKSILLIPRTSEGIRMCRFIFAILAKPSGKIIGASYISLSYKDLIFARNLQVGNQIKIHGVKIAKYVYIEHFEYVKIILP